MQRVCVERALVMVMVVVVVGLVRMAASATPDEDHWHTLPDGTVLEVEEPAATRQENRDLSLWTQEQDASPPVSHGPPPPAHVCIHDEKMKLWKDSIQVVEQDHAERRVLPRSLEEATRLNPSLVQHIRIKPVYSLLENDEDACYSTSSSDRYKDGGKYYRCGQKSQVLTDDKINFIKKLVGEAVSWLNRALYVEPLTTLRLSNTGYSDKCLEMTIPSSEYTKTHTDADYLIFITGRPTSGSVLAWAGGCMRDGSGGRPIAGQANFGPNAINLDDITPDSQVGTAIHEIMHALGFSSYWWKGMTKQLWSNSLGKSVWRIVSPQTAAKVKDHFGCTNWPDGQAGAELEDGGGSGSAGSHFEKRIFMNEIMSPTSSSNPIISPVTLAAFEDTGWYLADYNQAEINPWGRNAGCSFAVNSCSQWPDEYLCTSSSQRACTADGIARSYCNIVSYSSSLPSHYQYFSDSKKGGNDQYADFCPYHSYNMDCRITRSSYSPDLAIWAETFGPGSRCFMSTLIKKGWSVSGSETHGACHRVECVSGRIRVRLDQAGASYYCPRSGGTICDISGYSGCITCPPVSEVCKGTCSSTCNERGTCVNGECICGPGWGGVDCSTPAYGSVFRDVESVAFTALEAEVANSISLAHEEWKFFDVVVEASDANITITVEVSTGDLDVYVNPASQFDSPPTRTLNTWRSDQAGDTMEVVHIEGASDRSFAPGTLYIGVYGDAPSGSTGQINVRVDCPFIEGTDQRTGCLASARFCPSGCSLRGSCEKDSETDTYLCQCLPGWACMKPTDSLEDRRTDDCSCETRVDRSGGDSHATGRAVIVGVGVSLAVVIIILLVAMYIHYEKMKKRRRAEAEVQIRPSDNLQMQSLLTNRPHTMAL